MTGCRSKINIGLLISLCSSRVATSQRAHCRSLWSTRIPRWINPRLTLSLAMEAMRTQLQEQVYFVFDTYTLLNELYVLCVIGWHWDILKFERAGNELRSGKYTGEDQGEDQTRAIDDHVFNPRELLNSQRNDFSHDFKAEWNNAMEYTGLTTGF
jgi:hypothetical protein